MSHYPVQTLQARYVFPVTGPPVRNGQIVFDRALWSVGKRTQGEAIDLGNVAIVPGLVNAHTHLELSGCEQPLGNPTLGFPAWIGEVVRWRRAQGERLAPEALAAQREADIRRGLAENSACGVTRIVDIASPGFPQRPYDAAAPPTQTTILQEVLGLSTTRADELFAVADRAEGLSPHAPYTVGIELVARLAAPCRGYPIAMHLAESPEELELLRSHSGAFHTLLTELEAWDASAIPRGIAIMDYLKALSVAHRALVIHGNYLTSAEIDYLAANNERMSVVYCPRTHAYFGHARYPLIEMLNKGVNVALGTDSRASNPDLNLWHELRYVADHFPELSLETILRMGTINGAQAIGAATDNVGGFAIAESRGKASPPTTGLAGPANFVVIELPEEDAQDPYELLFDARSRVVASYCGGKHYATDSPTTNSSCDKGETTAGSS